MNRAFSRAECFWTTPPMKPSGNDTRQPFRIVPSSGFSSPAIMLMIVVLPVPLGARMPSEFPSSTRNEARSRITLRVLPVQKDLLTFSNSSIRWPWAASPRGPSYIRFVNNRYTGLQAALWRKHRRRGSPGAFGLRQRDLLDAEDLAGDDGDDCRTEGEERAHLRCVLHRTGREGHRGDEERDGEADSGDATDDDEIGVSHPIGQAEAQHVRGEPAEEEDADRLADDQAEKHEPGRRANRAELDAGVQEAEEEEDKLHRELQAVLHPVEEVGEILLRLGEDAEGAIGMWNRRHDRQEAERRMDARFLEAEPAQTAGDQVGPERQVLAHPGRVRAQLVAPVET